MFPNKILLFYYLWYVSRERRKIRCNIMQHYKHYLPIKDKNLWALFFFCTPKYIGSRAQCDIQAVNTFVYWKWECHSWIETQKCKYLNKEAPEKQSTLNINCQISLSNIQISIFENKKIPQQNIKYRELVNAEQD